MNVAGGLSAAVQGLRARPPVFSGLMIKRSPKTHKGEGIYAKDSP